MARMRNWLAVHAHMRRGAGSHGDARKERSRTACRVIDDEDDIKNLTAGRSASGNLDEHECGGNESDGHQVEIHDAHEQHHVDTDD